MFRGEEYSMRGGMCRSGGKVWAPLLPCNLNLAHVFVRGKDPAVSVQAREKPRGGLHIPSPSTALTAVEGRRSQADSANCNLSLILLY